MQAKTVLFILTSVILYAKETKKTHMAKKGTGPFWKPVFLHFPDRRPISAPKGGTSGRKGGVSEIRGAASDF
jgi:hypothetical protein